MSDLSSEPDLLVRLAEEFAERYRRGEHPELTEYAEKYPALAEQIRDLFPTLIVMEELGSAGGLSAPPAADGRAPRVLGEYCILREIGRGGMGVVYEAVQESLGRHVALKVLPLRSAGDPRALARFRRESRAAARLHHTNIIPIFEVGEQGDICYFAMQFIQGQSLDEVLKELQRLRARGTQGAAAGPVSQSLWSGSLALPGRGPDTDREVPASDEEGATLRAPSSSFGPEVESNFRLYCRNVARLGLQVADALAHAHVRGVVHRDIKPSNLLLDTSGVVWVSDFGLAQTEDRGLTQPGEVVGTLRYIPPERFRGHSDARGDIYSLGLTLYELLVLRPAFENPDRMRLIEQIAQHEPVRPRRLDRRIPHDLETVVLKAVEKDPQRRYQSAEEMAADLRRFLADEPIRARRIGLLERWWRWCRRHRAVAALTAVVALLLLFSAVGGLVLSLHLWSALEQSDHDRRLAQQAEREKTDKLWLAHYQRARAGRFSGKMGQRLDSLAALAEAAQIHPDERLRDEAIVAMALPDVRRVPGGHVRPPGTRVLTFDSSYRLLARGDDQGLFSIRRVAGDQEIRRIVSGRTPWKGPWFSPDNRFLASLDTESTLQVWRLADGERALAEDLPGCCQPVFSPDGRLLAVGQKEWVLFFDLETGQEVRRWRSPAPAFTLAFRPEGGQLAIGFAAAGVASVFDADNGALLTELPVGSITEQVVAWHPDGRRLAVSGSDPRVQIWDVAAKRRLALLEGHVQQVTVLSFHPDGELLATNGWEEVIRLWHPASGSQLMQLPVGGYPQFSPDGRWLGYSHHGDRVDLLEVTPSREYRTLVSSEGAGRGGYYFGDISPDGRLLVLGMDEGTRLWDLRSGQEVARLPGPSRTAFFDRRGTLWDLLASDKSGLYRWPARMAESGFQLGPPRQLSTVFRAEFGRGPEGHTLAAVYDAGAPIQVLDLQRDVVRQTLGAHPQGDGLYALSPDGHWLASCGWHSNRVRLWDVGTGEMAHEWAPGVMNLVFFTPDSRVLVISRGEEFSFWDVNTRQRIRELPRDAGQYPSWVAFSPDRLMMAVEMAPAVIHLKEVATGRTVARLEDPNGDVATWLAFTADGTQLVTAARYARAIHVWDLRAIRTRLKEMNLDWDWSEFPRPEPGPAAAPPMVTVITP